MILLIFFYQVWCVGELCSVRHDNRCTAETITRFFDTLEVLTYELSGMSSANLKEEISNPSKIICMLMSSISKVGLYCDNVNTALIGLPLPYIHTKQSMNPMSLIGRALVFKPKCLKLEPSCGHFPKWLQFLNMRKNVLNSTFLKNFPTLFSLDCFHFV